jgi:hypothetical protein
MNTALIKTKTKPIEGSVRLIPMNEGHEMGYSERYNGTEEKIFARTDNILKVLNELFPDGTWMVKIESNDVSEAIYLDETNIYDDEFNIIRKIYGESFVKHL